MKSLFTKFRHGLQRTTTGLVRVFSTAFSDDKPWDNESFERLEAALIGADLGVGLSMTIVGDLRDKYGRGESRVNFYLKERFGDGRIAQCSSVRFHRVSVSNLERKVMPNGELAVGPERFVLPTF